MCGLVFAALKLRGEDTLLTSMLTSLIRRDTPALEDALELIRAVRDRPTEQSAPTKLAVWD